MTDETRLAVSSDTTTSWLARIEQCRSVSGVAATIFDIAAKLSLSATAGGMLTGPKAASGNLFYFNNWPADWIEIYRAQAMGGQDPIVRWALGSGTPTTWQKLRGVLDPSDPGLALLDLASRHGYTEGFALPVRTGAGYLGLLSVAGDRPPLTVEEQTFLQVVGTAILNRAEALTDEQASQMVKALTRRERDCVALLVKGLGELDIAARLGISAVTARFHLDNARTKMRATSRAHLAEIMTGAMSNFEIPIETIGLPKKRKT